MEFDGLSPEQTHHLLYRPLASECILQLNNSIKEIIGQVPLFQLSELLLSEIDKSNGLKLTVTGNLPVHVCEFLLKQNLIHWEYMKYLSKVRDDEIPFLLPLREYLLKEGIVRKLGNKLTLTKKGKEFHKLGATLRFSNLLLFFANWFSRSYFYNIPYEWGQLGWAYSIVLLQKYGGQPKESEFYSDKLMQAFERELCEEQENEMIKELATEFHRAYAIRFFENFAN